MQPEQLYFDGQAPPDKIPAIETALHAWLEAKHEQKTAAETTKIKHAALLEQLTEHKLEVYSFLDMSGKRRRLWVKREPKAATSSVPKPRNGKAKRKRRSEGAIVDEMLETFGDAIESIEITKPDSKVEKRRVKRTAKHDEMADPFASTRAALEGAPAHANGVNPALTRGKGKRGK